jgi:PAS domain S-box-containing protein
MDESAYKLIEDKLRECQARYKSIIDAVTDYVFTVYFENNQVNQTVHSQTCEAVTGYEPADFILEPYLWIKMVVTEDHHLIYRQINDIKQNIQVQPIEHRIKRKDGEIRWVRATCVPAYDDKGTLMFYTGLIKDITDRKMAEISLQQLNEELEYRVRLRTDELAHANEHLVTEVNERKITEERLKIAYNELKATQEQLVQAEKMQLVGRLSSGVAHEVKNPLAIIIQGADFLSKNIASDNEQIQMTLKCIKEAVRRADMIIKGLLDFSSISAINYKPEDINAIITGSLNLVKTEIEKNGIEVIAQLQEGLPLINVDKNKMQQVFINLFLNAVQAMPDGGKLGVASFIEGTSAGNTAVIIKINDEGEGISEEVRQKIFEPFVTTKRRQGGTGIGLFIVRNIIKMHGADITIANRSACRGTEVVMRLNSN